jgi:hypothetical protein
LKSNELFQSLAPGLKDLGNFALFGEWWEKDRELLQLRRVDTR